MARVSFENFTEIMTMKNLGKSC